MNIKHHKNVHIPQDGKNILHLVPIACGCGTRTQSGIAINTHKHSALVC